MSTLGSAVTSPNFTIRRWRPKHDEAVTLVAEDRLSDEDIAGQLKVTKRALEYWKRDPQFQQRVTAYREKVRAALEAKGIREKQNRINAYNERWKRLHRVMDARAVDPTMAHVPGADTGLIVRTFRGVGKGEDFQLVEEYAVDTGMLKEMREHEKQAAIELQEWNEKDGKQGNALDVLTALAAFGRGEFDAPPPKQLPKATAATVAPDEDWGMPNV